MQIITQRDFTIFEIKFKKATISVASVPISKDRTLFYKNIQVSTDGRRLQRPGLWKHSKKLKF